LKNRTQLVFTGYFGMDLLIVDQRLGEQTDISTITARTYVW